MSNFEDNNYIALDIMVLTDSTVPLCVKTDLGDNALNYHNDYLGYEVSVGSTPGNCHNCAIAYNYLIHFNSNQ